MPRSLLDEKLKIEVFVLTKKIKRYLLAFTFLLATILMMGCNDNEPHVETSRTNQIPESGIIEREIFAGIMDDDDIAVFNGENNHISYQWLFIGSMMTEPKDENLLVNFTHARTDEVRAELEINYIQEFSFASTEKVGGDPTLTFYLQQPWEVESVAIYCHDEADIIAIASIENAPNAIITFAPQDFRGLFHIIGIENVEDFAGELTSLADLLGINDGESEGTEESATNGGISSDTAALGESNSDDEASQSSTADTASNNENSASSNTTDSGSSNNEGNTASTDGSEPNSDPVDPEDQEVNEDVLLTATLTIRVDTLVANMDLLDSSKHFLVPSDGVIMATRTVYFSEGESVYDVLRRETRASGIHMVSRHVPAFNSAYVEAINNLFEFDGGPLSGWMYRVNGWFPNFGASRYVLEQGDVIEWLYTVDLGRDIGGGYDW